MNRTLLSLPVLSLVPVLALASLVSADRIPVHRDLLIFVVPFKHFLGATLSNGEIPLWNPSIFLGQPFLASLQSGVFYPPSALLLLPFPLGFNAFLLVHFEIALAGMWLLLRQRGVSPVGSAIGGLTFALGGYMLSLLSLTNHLQTAVWAPWFLLAWSRWAAAPTVRCGLPVVVVLVLQILAGSPEHLMMTVAAALCVTLLELPQRGRRLPVHAAMLAAASIFAVGLAAFQILPTLEYLQHSTRGEAIPRQQAFHWSLQPASLLGLLSPHTTDPAIDTFLQSLYLGLAPLGLAIVALFDRARWPWVAVTAVGLLLALGDHTPFLPFLYDLLPVFFAKFRYPEKFFFFVHLAVPVLAAYGADLVSRRQGLGLLLVAVVAADLASASFRAVETASWRDLSSRPLAVDVDEMRRTHERVFHFEKRSEQVDATGLAQRPGPSGTEGDAEVWSLLSGDVAMVYGVANLGGADGIVPAWSRSLREALPRFSRNEAIRLLSAFSVGWLIGPEARESSLLERTSSPLPYFIYRVRNPLPIAYLVSRVREIPDQQTAIATIASSDFRLGEEAVVERLPNGWTDYVGDPRTDAVSVVSYGNEAIRLRSTSRDRAFVVLNDAFYPGWQARLDGLPAEIVRTNAFVRGISVTAGDHVIDFVYRPDTFHSGIWVSLGALIILALLAAAAGRSERARA